LGSILPRGPKKHTRDVPQVDTVVVLRSWPSAMHTLARLDVNGPVDLMHVVERAFPVRTNFFREQLAQSDHFHCSAAVAPVAMVPWTFIENKQVALKMRFVDPPPRKTKEKSFFLQRERCLKACEKYYSTPVHVDPTPPSSSTGSIV